MISKVAQIRRPAPPTELKELVDLTRDGGVPPDRRGLSNAEIGEQLFITDTTSRRTRQHVLQKLNLRDRVQAVVLAYQAGIVDEELD